MDGQANSVIKNGSVVGLQLLITAIANVGRMITCHNNYNLSETDQDVHLSCCQANQLHQQKDDCPPY